jgi:SPP1 family predicted phage head-tail adaptor
MRASNLDRLIVIEADLTTVDVNGVPQQTWTAFATMRAQLLQRSTNEFLLKGYGEDDNVTTGFRIRWLDGVRLTQRVAYNGERYRITEIKEIGRRVALELRCLRVTG